VVTVGPVSECEGRDTCALDRWCPEYLSCLVVDEETEETEETEDTADENEWHVDAHGQEVPW
jgi:hypothetical protein